jgi:hypothetical protein
MSSLLIDGLTHNTFSISKIPDPHGLQNPYNSGLLEPGCPSG